MGGVRIDAMQTKVVVARSYLGMQNALATNYALADASGEASKALQATDLYGLFTEIDHSKLEDLVPVHQMAIDILTRLNIPHDSEGIKNIATMPDYMEKLVTNDFKYDYYYQYFSFLKPFIPTKDYIANVEKYATNDWAEFWFNAGQIAGIIPGLAIGIWNLVMAIKDIAVLYGKLQVAQWSAIYAHVSNPVHAVQEDFAWLEKNIPTMVQTITDLFTSKDKNIACIFINLGKFVSAEVCKALTEWSQLDPGRQGYEVGELAGQILFEVAMWCVGVGEVSAAIKGSEATAKVVETLNSLKLGQLAEVIEKAVEVRKFERLLNGEKFIDKGLEEAYQVYCKRKQAKHLIPRNRLEWEQVRDYWLNDSPMARGNSFNQKAITIKKYRYHEINLANGKRLDSYDPIKKRIVSRKATDLEDIDISTFEGYLKELKAKYKPGTIIRSNKYKVLDGMPIEGQMCLEIPSSNKNFKNIEEYAKLSKDKFDVLIIFLEE